MKVLIGISGGVDSAVSAYLLKKQGYDVIGATMKLFDDLKTENMLIDAKKVCDEVGIKHIIVDLSKEFKEKVIDNFINSYKNGETPNPCVLCNKYLKFGKLFEKAKELGCDYIATGHYVDIENNCLCACNSNKDQSYFLYGINKEVLSHIIFPLKNYHNKEEIRQIAEANNLFVSKKKDSQEICFIPNDDYVMYLNQYLKAIPGNITLLDGTIIGKHDGLYKYTIGQRKGLNISYKYPLYVVDINVDKNELIVSKNEDLFNNKLIADNVNLLVDTLPSTCLAKVRSRGEAKACKVNFKNNKLEITFDEPVRAITKGQSVVLYKNNICLGGGIIREFSNN